MQDKTRFVIKIQENFFASRRRVNHKTEVNADKSCTASSINKS